MNEKRPETKVARATTEIRAIAHMDVPPVESRRIALSKFIATKWGALVLALAGIMLLFPYTATVQMFDILKAGEVAKETIIAPFTFDIQKSPEELAIERREVMEKVLQVFDYDDEALRRIQDKFRDLREAFRMLADPRTGEPVRQSLRTRLGKELSDNSVNLLVARPSLLADAEAIVTQVLSKGVASVLLVPSQQKLDELRASYNASFDRHQIYTKGYVVLRKDGVDITMLCTDIPVKDIALDDAIDRLRARRKFDPAALNCLYELLFAYVQPNVAINPMEYETRRRKAAEEVLTFKGKVIKDSEIVRKHQEVTLDIAQRLRSLHEAIRALDSSGERKRMMAANAGTLLLTLLPLLLFAFYLNRFHPRLMRNPRHLFALVTTVLLQAAVLRIGLLLVPRLFEGGSEVAMIMPVYLVPIAIASMLVTILFSLELGFLVTLYISIYVGIVLGFNHSMFIFSLLGGFVAGFSTKNIRYRWDFFRAIPPVAITYALLVVLFQFTGNDLSLVSLAQNLGLVAINATAATFLAMMAATVFETMFDLTTNMTLIELSDMNHPVLKKLSIEAAGTYNHSVLVGNLAESAAEAIGANALLARVASYYHDVGKLSKSEYFVENTITDRNRHAKLSPSMSALIISSHVKDGVEIARKSKLPRVIQDAILQHHGTSTVSFFFEKALEQDPHNQPQEEDYQYPGPRPQTRENAIIMLADSVEAASRSLATSSPKLLRELVKKIIRDKFMASQLDQCDLTLKDLDDIVEGFMPVLQGIFHTRIEYPNK